MRKHLRHVVKGLSWRAFAAIDTMFVVAVTMFWQTGKIGPEVLAIVGGVVGMELITKTGLYALHEKFWELPFLARF
jgi:hypothetical protein